MLALVISNSEDVVKSVERFFQGTLGRTVQHRSIPPRWPGRSEPWVTAVFTELSDWLDESLLGSGSLLSTPRVVVDLAPSQDSPGALDPLAAASDTPWAAVVAMLMLAFPEVHWITVSYEPSSEEFEVGAHCVCADHKLSDVLRAPSVLVTPLFDPSGLRSHIRRHLLPAGPGSPLASGPIPVRSESAVAVDDELSYAYLTSYVAFRLGYRVAAITSWEAMGGLLGTGRNGPGTGESPYQGSQGRLGGKIALSFEDLYLQFPDRPDRVEGFSDLRRRDEEFHALSEIPHRVLVTVGYHRTGPERATRRMNRTHLRGSAARSEIVNKPFAGLFDLMSRARLLHRDGSARTSINYRWPPNGAVVQHEQRQRGGGHSAPGRLLLVSDRLLARAKAQVARANSVPQMILGATLALEAKELLAGRTPTTTLEALAIQHDAEVKVESMFYGVDYNIDVKSRFREIEREVGAISVWFDRRSKVRSALNARLSIVESIGTTFRDLHQFEEEQSCLAEARRLRNAVWVRSRPSRWLLYPLVKYIEFTLRSFGHFVLVLAIWLLLYGTIYYYLAESPLSFGEALSAATAYSFTNDSAQGLGHGPPEWLWSLVRATQGVVTLFTVSLLVAHLYMMVARR